MIFATEQEGCLSLHGLSESVTELICEAIERKAEIAAKNGFMGQAEFYQTLASDVTYATRNPVDSELTTN